MPFTAPRGFLRSDTGRPNPRSKGSLVAERKSPTSLYTSVDSKMINHAYCVGLLVLAGVFMYMHV